jgi:chromosome segregation ATPase
MKDIGRRVRSEVEEEFTARLKAQERRLTDDVEELKTENASLKRRLEASGRDLEAARRKLVLSKEDGKAEAMEELMEAQRALEEQQEHFGSQTAELKRLREDQASLAGRLANALQLAQVSVIEADAAKAQAASCVADNQATHSALVQATHKIQATEAECAKLRWVGGRGGEGRGGECVLTGLIV